MRKERGEYKLYIVRGSSTCDEASSLLSTRGLSFVEVDVRGEGVMGFLQRDVNGCEIPSLVTPNGTYSGISEIEGFVYGTQAKKPVE